MKIISWNVNGLRSVAKKGFAQWMENCGADIVCLQEIKVAQNDIPFDLLYIDDFKSYFNPAQRKGYAGTAVYSKKEPFDLKREVGVGRFDAEGRIIEIDFGGFVLINLYLPHGARDKRNLSYKLEVYDCLIDMLGQRKDENIILTGDFNIAHEEIDLARPGQNRDNIMFTKEERIRLDSLIDMGFIDSFRHFNKEGGNYSWWPYTYNARENNIGWRIDYIFISKNLKSGLKDAFILPAVEGSDHCPVGIETAI
jgi:exodeoxyribonuclease III